MAGTYTVSHQTVFGDCRIIFYNVTNFTNAETLSVPGIRKILHASPVIATADKAVSLTTSGKVITFVTGADSYDGTLMVIGK